VYVAKCSITGYGKNLESTVTVICYYGFRSRNEVIVKVSPVRPPVVWSCLPNLMIFLSLFTTNTSNLPSALRPTAGCTEAKPLGPREFQVDQLPFGAVCQI
jgi:hypothetical protein